MPRLRRWTSLLLAAAACAGPPPPQPAPGGDLLTGAELVASHAGSAYDAVRRLRPDFLHGRGPTSVLLPGGNGPGLWIDDAYVGEVDQLRDVPAGDVLTVRYLPSWEATTRYGSGFPDGVLVVVTRP